MKIVILSVGKIKNINLQELINLFIKRINKYSKVQTFTLKENNNKSIKENILLETNSINEKLKTLINYEIILFDISGKNLSSIDISNIIKTNKNYKNGKIVFVIGGSNGVKKSEIKYNHIISLGKITLPHQIFKLIALEQIYRSFKIINNEVYNK